MRSRGEYLGSVVKQIGGGFPFLRPSSANRLGVPSWRHQLARHVNAIWALIPNQTRVAHGRLDADYGLHRGSASWA
jgi:hypothetical protein